MYKTFTLIVVTILLLSCHSDETDSKQEYKYKSLILKKIDVTELGYGQRSGNVSFHISGYEHYVAVENYDEKAWDNFLVDYADKYIDTCKTDLPVMAVTFCKPFNYDPYGDSRDLDDLQEHAIVTIHYGYETLYKKYPDIWGIEFWHNGKATYIQTQTLDRAKDKGYYDSSGNLKTDFIKEINKKFHTHF